jgi:hypothetical protein
MEICIEKEAVRTANQGGQQQFVEDWQHRIVALEGGQYAGKTYAGAGKLATLHLFNAYFDDGSPTFCSSLVVAPNFGDAQNYCVPALFDTLEEQNLSFDFIASGSGSRGRWKGPLIIIYDLGTVKHPSVMLIRSAEHPEAITGFTVAQAWGDEPARWNCSSSEPQKNPVLQVYGRVRDPRAKFNQILFTYTNEGDTTFIYEEMRKPLPDRKHYRAKTNENPVAKDFETAQRMALTPELAEQYLDGKAIHFAGGLVYNRFDFALNVDEAVILNPILPMQLSLDFNIAPGMHANIGQHDTSLDMLTICHELFGKRWSTVEIMRAFVDYVRKINWLWTHPLEVYGDATGHSKSTTTGESNYDIITSILAQANIPYRLFIPLSNPPVCDRVNSVNMALRDISDQPHCKIHPSCVILIFDYRKISRDKRGDIDKSNVELSHSSDADGYRINYLRPLRKYSITPDRFSV